MVSLTGLYKKQQQVQIIVNKLIPMKTTRIEPEIRTEGMIDYI